MEYSENAKQWLLIKMRKSPLASTVLFTTTRKCYKDDDDDLKELIGGFCGGHVGDKIKNNDIVFLGEI